MGARCEGSPDKGRDKFTLPPRLISHSSRELYCVGGIETDGQAKPAEDGDRAHVYDEVMIPK